MSYIPYILNEDGITVFYKNKPNKYSCEHPQFDDIVDAVREGDLKKLEDTLSRTTLVKHFDKSGFFYKKDGMPFSTFFVDDNGNEILVNEYLYSLMERFYKLDLDPTRLINFIKKIHQNPNQSAITDLYDFICYNQMPIEEDGDFLAYKWVRDDYYDCHSRTFRNKIGDIVEIERKACDPDRNHVCSTGLHFCSKDYGQFGSRLMVIKINPKDVTSIPTDYYLAKGRCCRYEVVDEIKDEQYGELEKRQNYTEPKKTEMIDKNFIITNAFSVFSKAKSPKKLNREFFRKHKDELCFTENQIYKSFKTYSNFLHEIKKEYF